MKKLYLRENVFLLNFFHCKFQCDNLVFLILKDYKIKWEKSNYYIGNCFTTKLACNFHLINTKNENFYILSLTIVI